MASSPDEGDQKFITEFLVLRLAPGVSFEASGSESNASNTLQKFTHLSSLLTAQNEVLHQFWGQQVENPHLFTWCISWRAAKHHAVFKDSSAFVAFNDAVRNSGLFILDGEGDNGRRKGPVSLLTKWSSSPAAILSSLTAPITEIAFFSLLHGTTPTVKSTIEHALEPINHNVQVVGKAVGAAIGWSTLSTSPAEEQELLCGIYGYPALDTHLVWRETEEHAQAGVIFENLEHQGVCLRVADDEVPGLGKETGWFHVRFAVVGMEEGEGR